MFRIGKYEVLNAKAVKKIMLSLKEQFCFSEKLDYVFLVSRKDKVFVLNKDVDLLDLESLRIDALGLYFGKYYSDGFRLSIEGAQLIGPKCACNVIEISQSQKHGWLKGQNLDVDVEKGFVLLKANNDFVGCAKVKNFVAFNSVPSARTLKVVNEEL